MSISMFDRRALPGFAAIAWVLLGLPLAAGGALAQGYPDPSERLDWTIAFGPGGGNDIMSRTLIDILDKYDLYPGEIVAENRVGGSGAVGWGHLYNQAGNPYAISSTSGSYITTPLQADTPWGPTDFTPIALMATDDLVLVVNGDSDIDDFEEFIERAKSEPLAIGGMGAVNVDFIVPTLLAEAAGFDFDYVSFNEVGELQTALLSDALDAMMANPGEIMGMIEAGELKALAYSGVETPKALEGLPTFQEAGYDVAISMPRGLVLAPDVPAEAQEWWIETMKKVAETPEWQEYVETNLLTENIRYGEEFRTFLGETQSAFEEILREQGAID